MRKKPCVFVVLWLVARRGLESAAVRRDVIGNDGLCMHTDAMQAVARMAALSVDSELSNLARTRLATHDLFDLIVQPLRLSMLFRASAPTSL